jgi:hypothetical protein
MTATQKFSRLATLTGDARGLMARLTRSRKQETTDAILARLRPLLEERLALIAELGLSPADVVALAA